MQHTLKRISYFGVTTYIRKKMFDRAPGLYKSLFPDPTSGFIPTAYGVELASNWRDGSFRMSVFGGNGSELDDLLKNRLSKPFTFLDVGANQGLFSLVAAKNPACVQALALEPVPDTFELLHRNVNHAEQSAKIQCIPAAVSSHSGGAEIKIRDGHSGAASMTDRDLGGRDVVSIKTKDAQALDALLDDPSDLVVKIDVEGFEEVVVPELLKLDAAQRITHFYCEIDLGWVDFDKISKALSDAGLTDQVKHGRKRKFDLMARRPQR
ncbi:FkbM family methyltransferase [uncultured Shimia sp.]|uniref:FkbM family methyltransferase n=1 Tax=uncultured Shimia sp. TaxID=573152 RepID=UPI0026059984|nr:FkbM family methyltransferase [uncultured Shimia sp.]